MSPYNNLLLCMQRAYTDVGANVGDYLLVGPVLLQLLPLLRHSRGRKRDYHHKFWCGDTLDIFKKDGIPINVRFTKTVLETAEGSSLLHSGRWPRHVAPFCCHVMVSSTLQHSFLVSFRYGANLRTGLNPRLLLQPLELVLLQSAKLKIYVIFKMLRRSAQVCDRMPSLPASCTAASAGASVKQAHFSDTEI